MRSVTITIESSEGAKFFLKKEQKNGGFDLTFWRAGTNHKTFNHYPTHNDAVYDMAQLAEQFIREVG